MAQKPAPAPYTPVRRFQLTDQTSAVRATAAQSAGEFDDSEREMLFELLLPNVKRHSNQMTSYDAYRSLIDGGVQDAASQFGSALVSVPDSAIPPAVGFNIQTLVSEKPEVEPFLADAIDKLAKSEILVGKSFKTRNG